MFYQIFLSRQVKQCANITYNHGIYKSPHDLANDLRLGILESKEISGNCLNFIKCSLVPSLPAKMKVLLILKESSCKIEMKPFQLCAISPEK